MWYIVYKEKFNGYFVGWKNKSEDSYSPNWFEANKYKSVGATLTRLGIEIPNYVDTMDKFIEANSLCDITMHRANSLNDLLDMSRDESLLFKKGRIDKIGANGEFLGSAEEDITEYIKIQLAKNKAKNDKFNKKFNSLTGGFDTQKIDTKSKDYHDEFDSFFGI